MYADYNYDTARVNNVCRSCIRFYIINNVAEDAHLILIDSGNSNESVMIYILVTNYANQKM